MVEVVERFKTQKRTAEILQNQNDNSKQEVWNNCTHMNAGCHIFQGSTDRNLFREQAA